MAKAVLTYVDSKTNNITLESGSLFYIDSLTKGFNTKKDIAVKYSSKIKEEDGILKLDYITSNTKREVIPIILNDKDPIYIRDDYLKEQISEIEKARKLFFNSKNKLFLKLALKYTLLKDTLDFNIKLSSREYKYALKKGLNVIKGEYAFYINTTELFKFVISNNKNGILRETFENALERWKYSINSLTLEEIYYYSRNIRLLIKKYNKKIKEKNKIKNFEPIDKNLKLFCNNSVILITDYSIAKVLKK